VNGRLEIICGCMFSGKTTELLRRLAEAEVRGLGVAAVGPARDTRYGAARLATHTGAWRAAAAIADAGELVAAAGAAAVVGVDEGHFFSDSILEPVAELVSRGRRVIVAGVPIDHRGRPFPPFPALSAVADEVVRLYAPCAACGAPAVHSQRMGGGDDAIVVGGAGMYEARCEGCFGL
jgi:thymidine kinase